VIVGAGPTGLTLAAQLGSFGVPFRIVDRAPTAVHDSRALAVQARTLEILQSFGLGEALVARGNPSARDRDLNAASGRPSCGTCAEHGCFDCICPASSAP
jgi:2-polyprenyl-6-methoxyphenol hydroxylase-like FAD-dependent oxidoreductase